MIKTFKFALIATTALTLCACGASERLANIGKAPEQSKIENPTTQPDYKPVSMPMPRAEEVSRSANSLWAKDKRTTFFKDQRARTVGDILTVMINIDDTGKIENETTRTRTSSETAALPNILGIESQFAKVLPEAVDPSSLVDGNADSNHVGNGEIDRSEEIDLRLAALVTQVLPNGNLVIQGRQEVRVNFENRILELQGVIRPEDITNQNIIPYDKIAEARIGYGGKGQLSDVQQPRYGQQVYDVIFPF